MRDKKLEKQIADVERFLDGWRKLGDIASSREKQEKIQDEELLRLKEDLACLHGSLTVSLGIEEKRGIDFLDGVGRSTDAGELQRLWDSWHSCLIFMDEVLGRLREERDELAALSRTKVATRAIFSNPFIRLAILFLCILLLYYIIKTFVSVEEAPSRGTSLRIERKI